MKYVPDRTGRFRERPHYDPRELDLELEQIVNEFLIDRHGSVSFPIPTDSLACLIERDAGDLDLYADLSTEGPDVEGVTDFVLGERPRVRIAHTLSNDPRRENRLRTTLTHEYTHVRLHDCWWQMKGAEPDLFSAGEPYSRRCKRENILNAGQLDWMEWQAGYGSGAILMPRGSVMKLIEGFVPKPIRLAEIEVVSDWGRRLIDRVAEEFGASRDAARVRLLQLRCIVGRQPARPLF